MRKICLYVLLIMVICSVQIGYATEQVHVERISGLLEGHTASQTKEIYDSNNYKITNIIYNGDIYLAENAGQIFISKDSNTWEKVSSLGSDVKKIIWDGKRFIAFSSRGNISFSNDGINWDVQNGTNLSSILIKEAVNQNNTVSLETKSQGKMYIIDFLEDVLWDGNKYIASCSNTGRLFVSYDGIQWEDKGEPKDESGLSGRQFFTFATNGKILVAGGNSGRRAISYDGVTWQDTSQPMLYQTMNTPEEEIKQYYRHTKDIDDIIWDGKQFIALASGKGLGNEDSYAVFKSLDGKTWVQQSVIFIENAIKREWDKASNAFVETGDTYGNGHTIIYTGEEYIIVATEFKGNDNSASYILKSKDLKNWNKIKISDTNIYPGKMIWDGKQLLIGGKDFLRIKFDQNTSF